MCNKICAIDKYWRFILLFQSENGSMENDGKSRKKG